MTYQYEHVLVTGVAGFIGFNLAKRLLEDGCHVTGIDNLNPYYDVNLKKDRLKQLELHDNFTFAKVDLADKDAMQDVFQTTSFDVVVNLAAQAGVRYSLENPQAYVDANIVGFTNILENCRHTAVRHLVYASSSSVYGANTKMPFRFTTTSITRFPFTRLLKRPTNSWRIHTATCLVCHAPVCGFLQCTVPGADRTWPCFYSPVRFWKTNPSRCSTTGKCSGISLISTILSKGSCGSWVICRFRILIGAVTSQIPERPMHPTKFTISGTTNLLS